jgi:glycerol-3-phosphate dehydrogenase (NAD(P)+)
VNTAIIGAGGWGTALAGLWAKDGRKLFFGATTRIDRTHAKNPRKQRLSSRLLLPDSVHITSALSNCADADLIVLATPSTALRNIATQLAKIIHPTRAVLLSAQRD